MRSKIRCPACRKGVAVSPADAGRPVLCLACGRSFVAPPDPKPARVEGEAMLAVLLAAPDGNGNAGGNGSANGNGSGHGTSVIAAAGDTGTDAPAADTRTGSETALAVEVAELARAGATRATSAVKTSTRVVSADDVARWRRWAALGWGVAAVLGIGWLLQNVARQAPPSTRDKVAVAPALMSRLTDGAGGSPATERGGSWPTPHVEPAAPSPAGSRPAADADVIGEGDGLSGGPPGAPSGGADPTSSGVVQGPGEAQDAWDPTGDATGPAPPPLAGESANGPPSAAAPPPGTGLDEADEPAAHAAPVTPPLSPPTTKRSASGSSMAAADWRPVLRRRPPLRPIPAPSGEVSDEQIENAIRRAANFLLGQFDNERGFVPAAGNPGEQSLATYALIQAGLTVKDERLDARGARVNAMLDALKRLPVWPNQATYHRSVRAAALALLNRPQDRKALNEDVRRLVGGHVDGGYTYALPDRPKRGGESGGGGRGTDNSNSQYGLLGVWSGAEAGVEVPGNYWEAVNKHWTDGQLTDGSWPYAAATWVPGLAGEGYASMAAAGTASLFVTYDHLSRRSASLGRDPFPPALERALNWWETSNTWLAPVDPHSPFGSRFWGYQLYGIERVGLASGFKYFGNHDWYRKLAGQAVARQGADGSWMSGDVVNTSYALLFLARGRPPIMMNKLRFDGFWANRPRDLANLARFATHSTERPLNWQVVDLRNEWHDWLDAPILYVASHLAPAFTGEHHDKLREYALAGGMIFTHADGGRHPFNDFAEDLARALFPRYEFVDLPPDHAIYNLVGKVEPRPRLQAVSNGSRILMLHSPTDLSQAWQTRDDKRRVEHFNLGLNLFFYATGKRDLRSRLDSPYVPPVSEEELRQHRQRENSIEDADEDGPGGGLRVARLRYGGHWDPEPSAWPRFARLFHRRTGTPLEVATVAVAELTPDVAPVAHLTGTARYEPTADEVEALRSYVEGGGVLLVDNCGGTGAFAVEMKDVLGRAFPGRVLDPVRGEVPFLRAGPAGMADVTKPRYRPFAAVRQGDRPGLYGFRAGEGVVLLTTLDLTSGLLRTGTWGIHGYDPAYCEMLVQNLVLWTHDTRLQ